MKKIVFSLMVSVFAFANIQALEAVNDQGGSAADDIEMHQSVIPVSPKAFATDENEKQQGVTPKLKRKAKERSKRTSHHSANTGEMSQSSMLPEDGRWHSFVAGKGKRPSYLQIIGKTLYIYNEPSAKQTED